MKITAVTKILVLFSVLVILLIAPLNVMHAFSMEMSQDMHSAAPCPIMGDMSNCPLSLLDHHSYIDTLLKVFPFQSNIFGLLVLISSIVFLFVINRFLKYIGIFAWNRLRNYFRQINWLGFPIYQLQFAFARGILHSKAY